MFLFSTVHFRDAIERIGTLLRDAPLIHTEKWQGLDIRNNLNMAMHELLNVSLSVDGVTADLNNLRADVDPNLPWADDHFLERVNEEPLNPGVQWRNWPWARSADRFRTEKNESFTHTYMQRYWPKFAGVTSDGRTKDNLGRILHQMSGVKPHDGIRYVYGDLNDVISLLHREPHTRQAYLPVWFPEDTGVSHGGRVPCTLGYHFIMRDDALHVVYYLRSCDYRRHFRDDIYLTVRLLIWMLSELKKRDAFWGGVSPGTYTMHVTSMHIFQADLPWLTDELKNNDHD